MVTQSDVWLVALDPTVGKEIKKTRPAVIISPNDLNQSLETVIIAPMTTGAAPAPFRVPVMFEGKRGLVLMEQVRSIDKTRLIRRLGRLSAKILAAALAIAQEMFTV